MLLEKQGNEAACMTSGSSALWVESPNSSSGRSEKHVRVHWIPSKGSVALWPWSYSYSNRAAYISINYRRAVRTVSAYTWQGTNQRTHDLWPTSCALLLMRANLQFLNICDVLYMWLQLPLQRKISRYQCVFLPLGLENTPVGCGGFKQALERLTVSLVYLIKQH